MSNLAFSNGKSFKRVATVGQLLAELHSLPADMPVFFDLSGSSIELALIHELRPGDQIGCDLHILAGHTIGDHNDK